MCCPAINKAWVPCEPHHHQQNKEAQDTHFSKRHGPQLPVLLTDYIVSSNILLCLHGPTAPCLLQARGIIRGGGVVSFKILMQQRFLMLAQVSTGLQPNSLESHVDKLQPKPGQCEHENHVRESKAEPGGKVYHVIVFRKDSKENKAF